MTPRAKYPRIVACLTFVACLLAGTSARPTAAQTFSWINSAGGTFGTSTNWSPLGPPSTQSHTALFNTASGNYTVSLGANHTVGTLVVGSAQNLLTINTLGRTMGTVFGQSYASSFGVSITGGGIYGGIQSVTDVRGNLSVGTGTLFRTSSLLVGTPAGGGAVSVNAATINTLGAVVGREGFGGGLTLTNGSVGSLSFIDVGQPGLAGTGSLNVLTNSSLFVGTIQLGAQGTFVTGSNMTVSGGGRVTMYPNSPLTIGGSTIGVTVSFPNINLNRTGILNITANSSTFSPGTPGTFTTSTAPITVNYGGAINVSNGTFNVNGDLLTNGAVTVGAQGSYLQGPALTTRVDGTTIGGSSITLTGPAPSFIGNGTVTGGTLVIGSGTATNGWATLFSSSSIHFSTATIVGESGTGRLDAVTLNTPSLAVGRLAGGVGTFNAGFYDTGTVSTDRSGSPVVGSVIAGNSGAGVVQVRLGSTMTVNGPTDVGLGTGSAGTILLAGDSTGTLATYAAPGQRMNVGSAGAGTLLVGPFSVLNVGTLIIGPSAGGGTGTGVQTGGTVSVSSGTLQVNARGRYTLSGGTLAAAVDNLGTFTYAGGALGGSIVNIGTLALNAPLPAGAMVSNTATGRLVAPGGLFAGNGTISNAGSFGGTGTLAAGMTLHNTGTLGSAGGDFVIASAATFTNAAGSLVRNAPASTLRIRAFLANEGNVEVNAGGAIETAYSLNVLTGQKLTLKGGLLSIGDSVVGDNLVIFPGATAIGFGQINASMYNSGSTQFNGPTQIVGLFRNDAALNVRNATTVVYGPAINNGSITVNNGTIVFEQAFARGPADGSGGGGIDGTGITSVLPGGRLVADAVRQGTLELAGSSTDRALAAVRPASAGGGTSVVRALTIAGSSGNYFGQFDIADTALVIDYTGPSPLGAVRDQLVSGYAGGAWTGFGIASSTAAGLPNRALGFGEAAELFGSFPAVFAGEPVDDSSVLVRFTLPGDANLDRAVNIGDFARLAANFNQPSTWSGGDFTYDGTTGIGDFALLAANFNQTLPAPLPRGSAVPEPAWGSIALLGVLGHRRRR